MGLKHNFTWHLNTDRWLSSTLSSFSSLLFSPAPLYPRLPSFLDPPNANSPAVSLLTYPRADLVVVEVDVISAGNRWVLSLLSALAGLLLLHLPLLWGHNNTGSPPEPQPGPDGAAKSHYYHLQPRSQVLLSGCLALRCLCSLSKVSWKEILSVAFLSKSQTQ